jgi:sec-independent protein translocase protein TatC
VIRWIFRKIIGWFRHTAADIRNFFKEEPEDNPLPDTFAKTIENPNALLEHLDALRKNLFRAVVFFFITTAFSFVFARQILDFLAIPLKGGIKTMVAIEVTEPVGVLMKVSLLSGFVLALPYIAFEMWRFIGPGLSRRTRVSGLFAIPVVVAFFIGGMAFSYYIMLPAALPFLLNILGFNVQVRPSNYFSFVTSLLFWVGAAFEFPLIIWLMASIGLVKSSTLLNQWRLAIVIIAVAAAAITPTVDPFNMALVMAPMIGLYFLSIGLAKFAESGRKA